MNTRMRPHEDERGFTLVEMLIVIVVLGVLAGVTVLAVGGIDKRGIAAACRSDFKSVETAQQAYYAKNRSFAADVPALVTAQFLASAPANTDYTIKANTVSSPADGKVQVVTTAATGGISVCDPLN